MFGIILTTVSCGKKTEEIAANTDVLVSVGDSTLMVSDVVRRIPAGLTAEDSINLFNRIVEDWVRDLVLADYAEKNITDMERIERMVESYRNNLIINEYIESMSESQRHDVSEDRIQRFYDASRESMVLEQPIVKGVLLKVAETDESLPNLRKWLVNLSDADLDKIEKDGLRRALMYKYFKDEWVEWDAIADRIPYRFYDADAFLRSTNNFETSDAGSVYLFRITDFVPSGEEMPYDFARVKIAYILRKSEVGAYRKKLVNDIYKRKIKEGVLKPGIYNPVEL